MAGAVTLTPASLGLVGGHRQTARTRLPRLRACFRRHGTRSVDSADRPPWVPLPVPALTVCVAWANTLQDLERQLSSLCGGIAVSAWAQGSHTETPGPPSRGRRLAPGTWEPGCVGVESPARGERTVRV